MARLPRLVVPHQPHHVVQRGNRRLEVFFSDADRIVESGDMLRELIEDWKSYLRDDDQEDFLKSVRRDSLVNRPLGDEAFVSDLEKRFHLRLSRGKVGRPVTTRKEK